MTRRCYALTTLFLSLNACHTSKLCVNALNTSQAQVRISVRAGRQCDRIPEISVLSFRDPSSGGDLWFIGAMDTSPIDEVLYGTVPAGFSSGLEPAMLSAGQPIRVDVRGPGQEGFVAFTISE